MQIIRDNQVLPRPMLQGIATVGWISVLYLAYVVGMDSWDRTMFSLTEIRQGLPDMDPFNQRYVDNPRLTLFHTIPGLLFSILGPLQFMSPVRRHAPMIHRLSGRIFLLIAMSSGIAAIMMGLRFPVWGWSINQFITLGWSVFMLFAFSMAFVHIRARRFPLHREWMIRGFATGLGVALFRVLLDDVLPKFGMEFTDAWNTVMAISMPLTLAAAEFWIRVTRPKRRDAAVIGDAAATAG